MVSVQNIDEGLGTYSDSVELYNGVNRMRKHCGVTEKQGLQSLGVRVAIFTLAVEATIKQAYTVTSRNTKLQ